MYQCQHATLSVTSQCTSACQDKSQQLCCLHEQHVVDWIHNWQQLMAMTTTLSFRPAAVDTVNSIKERLLKARNYSVAHPENAAHVLGIHPRPDEVTQVIL